MATAFRVIGSIVAGLAIAFALPIWFKMAILIAIPAAIYLALKPPRRREAIPTSEN